ncbi:hypothetical protein AGABI1DRAFT_116490 [Agaricus bisporus var. burnettii JB137-S8]|uniref:GDP/GTP exchange factor Sec2 N-terminal domain-containing protein n=1 Tax=Agaricus bisporus var. burnettii (strain JB137-S8 / ATCC MYA-4627 / FGSC 10392) TaxID=597362 RepID=K5WJ31_AGABU|nr:uncharacterized protein AGABI1DRAFT_116490 [Agaricus bisporus var. burnettii JB137-S8]EKM75296.1 hypothetical protein AGABI1DRAFT_116490 [Agaricus bisporus var. burnettii JB137-S8]
MLHFPSSINVAPKRTDSLNATQRKMGSNPILMKIEEELHDVRRVQTHGQEEDLRLALDMLIHRVTELTSTLSEVYKSQADLEVELNVAKSNLALVIANNEMLEEALHRDNSGSSKDVGWQRRSGHSSGERQSLEEWQQAVDFSAGNEGSATAPTQIPGQPTPAPIIANQGQDNGRFFRFRFSSPSTSSRPTSRPSTPSAMSTSSPQIPQRNQSPNLPSPLPSHVTKELEGLNAELEKERSARKSAQKEKASLEAELESLSQALFEEANKMVAIERIKLAETEEELKELRTEKDALKKALRLIEGENCSLRQTNALAPASLPDLHESNIPVKHGRPRSSSEVAIKSRPGSINLPASPFSDTPASPDPSIPSLDSSSPSTTSRSPNLDESQPTPKMLPTPLSPPLSSFPSELDQGSPWADVTSPSTSEFTKPPSPTQFEPESLYVASAITTL